MKTWIVNLKYIFYHYLSHSEVASSTDVHYLIITYFLVLLFMGGSFIFYVLKLEIYLRTADSICYNMCLLFYP